MLVKSFIDLKTNIVVNGYYPEENSHEELVEYLDKAICKTINNNLSQKGVLEIQDFGQVSYIIDVYEYINDDYISSLRIRFEYDDSLISVEDYMTEDYIGETLSKALTKDISSYTKLKEDINNFIEILNDHIKDIVIPKNEYYMFCNDNFYIRFPNNANYAHTVEWVSLVYSNDFDFDSMIEDIQD